MLAVKAQALKVEVKVRARTRGRTRNGGLNVRIGLPSRSLSRCISTFQSYIKAGAGLSAVAYIFRSNEVGFCEIINPFYSCRTPSQCVCTSQADAGAGSGSGAVYALGRIARGRSSVRFNLKL